MKHAVEVTEPAIVSNSPQPSDCVAPYCRYWSVIARDDSLDGRSRGHSNPTALAKTRMHKHDVDFWEHGLNRPNVTLRQMDRE